MAKQPHLFNAKLKSNAFNQEKQMGNDMPFFCRREYGIWAD